MSVAWRGSVQVPPTSINGSTPRQNPHANASCDRQYQHTANDERRADRFTEKDRGGHDTEYRYEVDVDGRADGAEMHDGLVVPQEAERRAAMKRDFLALYEPYMTEVSLQCPRNYFLVHGRKR